MDGKTGKPLVDNKNRPQDMHRSVRAYDPQTGTRLWASTPPVDVHRAVKVILDPTATRLSVQYTVNGQGVTEMKN